jgi:hypothetical protein
MKHIKLVMSLVLTVILGVPYIGYALSLEFPIVKSADKIIKDNSKNPFNTQTGAYASNLQQSGLKNATLGNCFDVYKFDNVKLNVNLDLKEYEPGRFIQLTGSIENNNNYPMPDLAIKGKIVKIEQEGAEKIVKIVDEIVLKENINLASLGSKEINEIYNLPIKAAKGDYEILLSVVQNDQMSISGLSFSDDVYASNTKFKIGGNNVEEIFINQKDIKINGERYNNLSSNPKYKGKNAVKIDVPIQNNSAVDKEVEIEYTVYSWSDDLKEIKKELKQLKTIAKKGNSIASYTIEDQKQSVYYVKIKVKDDSIVNNTSWENISNIRFINEDIAEPRIAALTINTSPYNPEKDIQLLTCIHNASEGEVETILENTIKDDKGRVIASSEYRGPVSKQVDGIYTNLPKKSKYNQIIATSTIKDKDGNVLNTVELNYNCQDLDPSQCESYSNNINNMLTIGISTILVIGISILGYRRYKAKSIIQ